MNNNELKDMTSILEYCRCLNSKITTVLIEKGVSHRYFEHNILEISSNIDNETTPLNKIINAIPDNKEGN